jgi:hypothetical protein
MRRTLCSWAIVIVGFAALAGGCATTPKGAPTNTDKATKTGKTDKTGETDKTDGKTKMPSALIGSTLPLKKLQQAKVKTVDAGGLVAVIIAPKGAMKAGDKLELTFELQNPQDTPGSFCDYHTPFEGIRNNLFELVDDKGKKYPYQGKMAKRAPPGLDDFWVVPPKSRVQVRFDLAEGYSLNAGTYTLRFAGNDISGLPASKPIKLVIE